MCSNRFHLGNATSFVAEPLAGTLQKAFRFLIYFSLRCFHLLETSVGTITLIEIHSIVTNNGRMVNEEENLTTIGKFA